MRAFVVLAGHAPHLLANAGLAITGVVLAVIVARGGNPRIPCPAAGAIRTWVGMHATRFVLLLSVAGCVTVDPESMGDIDAQGLSEHPVSLALDVTSRANVPVRPAGEAGATPPEVTADDLRAAIQAALQNSRFVAAIEEGSELTLQAELQRCRLLSDLDTAEVVIEWTCSRRGADAPLWQSMVHSKCTKGFMDHFNAYRRMSAAFEGAIRDNIQQALLQLEASHALDTPAAESRP